LAPYIAITTIYINQLEVDEDELNEKYERQKKEAAQKVSEARRNSPLPQWCLDAIAMEVYQSHHSSGQQECDMVEASMINDFEGFFNKA